MAGDPAVHCDTAVDSYSAETVAQCERYQCLKRASKRSLMIWQVKIADGGRLSTLSGFIQPPDAAAVCLRRPGTRTINADSPSLTKRFYKPTKHRRAVPVLFARQLRKAARRATWFIV